VADEPSFLRRVREWLGSVSSSPEEIERIVTEATVDWGGRDLETRPDQLTFVDGPLAGAVSRALSPQSALRALRTIGSAVATESKGDRATPVYLADDRVTGRIPLSVDRRVPVLVVAQSDSTANRLSVLLGEERARVEGAHDRLTFVAGLAEHPQVVVIDATDPLPLGPEQIVSFIERGLPHAFWIVWGKDRDLGRALDVRLRAHTQPHVMLSETDGLGPIIDVVLSRRSRSD
jgi:hypothetical protein